MVIHRALDEVLRSWSHVAVLRALLDTNAGCTGNEVARRAGMHARSALKALSSLEELSIVRRQRGGRDHLFTLNREHFLVRSALVPLYDAEQKFPEEIMQALSVLLDSKVVCAVIFGSVAKKQETPRSDLDLCCVVKGEKQKDLVRDLLETQAPVLSRNFGVRVAPLFFTADEFRTKSRNPLIKDIIRNGKVIVGKKPRGVAA